MAGIRDSIAVKNSLVGTLYTDSAIASSVGTAYNPTYALVSEAGAKIVLFINNADYKMYAQLKDKNGNLLYTSNIIDLPLESVVMNGRYDSTTKEVVLTLVNGNEIRFSVEDLVRGLVDEDQLEEALSGYWSKEDLTEEDIENWNNKQDYLNQGENVQIYSDLTLKGNIEQDSTTGKNLLKLKDTTNGGLTTKVNDDGSISVSGTSTGTSAYLDTGETTNIPIGTYTLSIQSPLSINLRIFLLNNNTQFATATISAGQTSTSITTEQVITSYSVILYGLTANTSYNFTIYPMIENGSTATDYEPYTNGASPNPSYPQDIHIVSGDNEIKVEGKNLAQRIGGYLTADGTFKTSNDDSFYFPVMQGETYTYNTTGNRTLGAIYDNVPSNNATPISGTYSNNMVKNTSFTASATGIMVIYANTPSSQNTINSFIAVKGNEIGDYEPHQEYTKEINLPVENLANVSIIGQVPSLSNGQLVSLSGSACTDYIEIDNTKDYTFSFSLNNTTIPYITFYGENDNYLGYNQINSSGYTLSTSTYYTNTRKIRIRLDQYERYNYLQLEPGSKANSYTPYGTTPIEMGGIGDYEDEFFKNTTDSEYYDSTLLQDKWYLKKRIGKYIFTGNETPSAITGGYFYYASSLGNMSYIIGGYNTKFQFVNDDRIIDNGSANNYLSNNQMAFRLGSGKDRLYIKTQLSSNDLKSTLANTPLYYVLTTPENILLNDTLQEQLNGLSADLSNKEMINIIQENNDLPFIINYDNTKLTIDVPCAGAGQGGVIKVSDSYATATADGVLTSQTKTYAQYNSLDNNAFVSKGTLENVLNKYIGDIDTALDAINGEVI